MTLTLTMHMLRMISLFAGILVLTSCALVALKLALRESDPVETDPMGYLL